ncbi:MAG: hypothetical protein IPK26_06420 [Planctomycetes bacterium]|nr:hypothetical protein [Planctomycetota bacterium]
MANHHRPFLILCGALGLTSANAQSVSPADRTNLEGSSFTHYPLGRASTRMQTLHDDLPAGTVLRGHAYRRDAAQLRGVVDPFACDLQVTVSMAPHGAAAAATTFANNVGANPIVVLPRTTVPFAGTNRPALDPATVFELVVPWTQPFTVPAGGGTVCVDIEVFGNNSAGGSNRNLSPYLDAHTQYGNGRNEQEGYRTGLGCAAPGSSTPSYATMTMWHLGSAMQLDVALRQGVADDGSGATRIWVELGHSRQAFAWPGRPDCTMASSTEVWFQLPGTTTSTGSFDGGLTGMPVLPPGYRLWCQAGSIHTGNGDLAFGDVTTLVTPPAAPGSVTVSRVAHATDHASTTGTVSLSVPVMQFF